MYKLYFDDINEAKKTARPWESNRVRNFKNWLKNNKLKEQNYFCCYCLRDLSSESYRAIHIEHVLPKSKFPAYVFDSHNLSVSCIKCNCDNKLNDTSFLNYSMDKYRQIWNYRVYDSSLYKFVHPKLDNIHAHIKRNLEAINNRPCYIYKYFTSKGKYHYDFFKLAEFEVSDISRSQGLNTRISNSGAENIVDAIFRKHT